MSTEPRPTISISCDDCELQHTDACADCLVTFVLGREPNDAIVVDAAEGPHHPVPRTGRSRSRDAPFRRGGGLGRLLTHLGPMRSMGPCRPRSGSGDPVTTGRMTDRAVSP